MVAGFNIAEIAAELLAALDGVRQVDCLSARHDGYDLEAAYGVADAVTALRVGRGEAVRGLKIGFTNRQIWEEYQVFAPIFAPVYDTTLNDPGTPIEAANFCEPRLEPEIYFILSARPNDTMSDAELLGCCSHYGHGIEIVQSLFADWRFAAADTVAGFGLHGAYLRGAGVAVPADAAGRERLAAALRSFALDLIRDGTPVETGRAENILGHGPLEALRHLARVQATQAAGTRLAPGQLVTTGTVTAAYPIAPGQTWHTALEGLDLPGLELAVC